MEMIELEHVYRQKDQKFIDILNAIRNNSVTEEALERLNERVDRTFQPSEKDFYIYLVPTNAYAASINEERLEHLKGKCYAFEGIISGAFESTHLPTQRHLTLKVGAQVMMVNNDARGRWINGTIGKVLGIEKEGAIITELETGKVVEVLPYEWELYKYFLNEGGIQSEVVGTFTQYPLKLAWAITIHKSQGKTFNKAIIDVGNSVFVSGQTYVALSRCTSLEGMILKKPIEKKHIWSDYHIVKFVTQYQYDKSEQACSITDKIKLLKEAANRKQPIRIVYLKATDTKSKRTIIPLEVGDMDYKGKPFQGVIAYCLERKEERVFRVDRILDIEKERE